MKRALITTDLAKPQRVSIDSQVQTHQSKERIKEVMDWLYQTANDSIRTHQEIFKEQKNYVINNFVILSEGADFELQQAFVIMTKKSHSSITPHDFSFMLYELEKQAPDYLKNAIRDFELTGLEDHLTEGIERYNHRTGEQVTFNRMDLTAVFPGEMMGEIIKCLPLPDQINVALTRKSHEQVFQNLYYSKIKCSDGETIKHLKTMSSYAIYKNIPSLRKFPCLADDKAGMEVLRVLKVGGLKTIQAIKNGTFTTIEEALESRKVELQKLMDKWDQLSDEFKAVIVWPIVSLIHQENIEELGPYIQGAPDTKTTVELLIEEGLDSPHIKYIGDGSINIDEDVGSYIPLGSEDQIGNLRFYGYDQHFEHTYIDTGLIPVKFFFSLEADQLEFLMHDWIVKYVSKGVLTLIDIEEVADIEFCTSDVEEKEKQEELLHKWTQKIIDNDQISFKELRRIFGFRGYQRALFELKPVQDIINTSLVPFEQVYDLDEDQCNLLIELLAKPHIVNTLGLELLSHLFSWKLDVLFNCKGFKQKIGKDTELMREFLSLPDFVEQHLDQPHSQEMLDNGSLTLEKIKEMVDLGTEEFNEQMSWINIVGNQDLILYQAEK